MKRPKQLTLTKEMIREVESGGDYSNGRRKSRRPFISKEALHIVCRSEIAKDELSLLLPKNRQRIDTLTNLLSIRFGIKIYDRATNQNHLHFLLRAQSKTALTSFLRALPGMLAMRITGAKKGSPLTIRFWTKRIWSRIVSFGRDFRAVKKYIMQNTLEALGLIPYTPRKIKKRFVPI